ncbi:Uncharacterised protein [Chlamydia abortus]|nr:Uncharacterised protein [Chlamydia abortus]
MTSQMPWGGAGAVGQRGTCWPHSAGGAGPARSCASGAVMRAQCVSRRLRAVWRAKLVEEELLVSSGCTDTEGPAGGAAGWRAPCPWHGSRGPGTSGGMQSCRQHLGANAAPLPSHRLMRPWRSARPWPGNP